MILMEEHLDPVSALDRVISSTLLTTWQRGERKLPGRAILHQSASVREALSNLKSADVANLRRDDLALFSDVYLKDDREKQEFLRRQERMLARRSSAR
jgi:hypothetical protein